MVDSALKFVPLFNQFLETMFADTLSDFAEIYIKEFRLLVNDQVGVEDVDLGALSDEQRDLHQGVQASGERSGWDFSSETTVRCIF